MKLSKKETAEVIRVYETWLSSYISGDIETYDSYFDEAYRFVGSTNNEEFLSRKETTEFFRKTADQLAGKTELRNNLKTLEKHGELILISHFFDAYFLNGTDWIYYERFRFTSTLHKTERGYLFLYQHFSTPDTNAEEGETIGFDQVNAENRELREAVKRRTAELENKNRELSIEAALEKVRAVAMGMKKPEDMLDVCRVISDQLQDFGVDKIRNVQIAIIDENIGQYLCYQFFTPYDKTAVEITEYLKSPVEHGMVKQMLASRDGYFIGSLSGKELEEFRSHRIEENHFPDPFLDKATELDYCFLSIGEGGIGLTLYQSMAEDVLTLFKRFHQVFSLAYQRFRDIQKAEAQAREAQIEVAVERVRAQSMAMHHPDDLDKVNKEILTQLNWLQIQGLSGVTFYLVDQDGWVKAWDFSSPGNIGDQKSYTLQFDFKKYEMMGYPFKIFQQTNLNYLVADYPLEKLERAVFEIEEINPEVATVVKEALAKGILTHQWSACARISDGMLAIDLVNPPSEDTKTIVLKIAGAFNQAYQRFLDLQKAEAHARESEIDLALERVRAQTMAMHSSEDVGKCVVKMFSELTALGVDEGTRFGIGILNHENENNQLWTARKDGDEVNMHIGNIDMASHPLLKSARKAWKEQVTFHRYVLEGEDLLNYYQMLNNAPDYKIQIPLEKLPKKEIQHCFIFEHGFFYAFSPREFQPDLIQITKRFSSLFEQTYRRYLDLVRAEGQAREAEIELALERVRARTMAMHHTEELKDVIQVVFDQFVGLKINVEHAGFILDYKEQDDMHIWLADLQQGVPTEIIFPYFDSPHWISYLEAKAKEESFFANLLPFEVKNKFYRDLFELIPELTEEAQQAIFSKPGLAISTVLLDNVGLYIEHYSETPFSAEENAILMRFGKVFQQTYTRFLDLKKAEAQAREAQIEVALERVRAKAMSMQKPDELKGVALELRKQLGTLEQEALETCAIHLYEESPDYFISWAAMRSPKSDTEIVQIQNRFPKRGVKIIEEMMDCYHSNKKDYVLVNEGQKFKDFIKMLKELSPDAHKVVVNSIKRMKPKDVRAFWSLSDFKGGSLIMSTVALPDEATRALLRRFANVFSLAYQRFIDLQKAEAQTREAQINLAVERVRAKALAMHRSEEIIEVVAKLKDEVMDLNIPDVVATTIFLREGKDQVRMWDLSTVQKRDGGFELSLDIPFKLKEKDPHLYVKRVWENPENYCVELQDQKGFARYIAWLREHDKNQVADELKAYAESGLIHRIYHVAKKLNSGKLVIDLMDPPSAEIETILTKMGAAFDLAYKRFEDIQKAEAQARESQIQLALERVRARTMAMHISSELKEVVSDLFKQLDTLGLAEWGCAIMIFDENLNRIEYWVAEATGATLPSCYYVEGQKHPVYKKLWQQWKNQAPVQTLHHTGKVKRDFDKYWLNETDFKGLPKEVKDSVIHEHEVYLNFISMRHGLINAAGYQQLPDDKLEIIMRFAKVFEQTYTRFLDLQKAEAQAREAEIELSLERVRARTMAMHKSDELGQISALLFKELRSQGLTKFFNCSYVEVDQKNEIQHIWTTNPDGDQLPPDKLPLKGDAILIDRFKAWKEQRPLFFQTVSGNALQKHIDFVSQYFTSEEMAVMVKNYFPHSATFYCANFSQGYLHIITESELTIKEEGIFIRFTQVFKQAYTRFLDLQKAEAQVREAQIEAALERVRSKSLAMHKTDELQEVVRVVAEELKNTGVILDTWGAVICTYFQDSKDVLHWTASEDPANPSIAFLLPYFKDELFDEAWESKERGDSYFAKVFSFEVKNAFFNHAFEHSDYRQLPDDYKKQILESETHGIAWAWAKNSAIMIPSIQGDLPSGDEKEILIRFAKVFEQSFIRFLDLQKAEAQAREAQIEAALERVRSRSMAMHKSEELAEVSLILFEQVEKLGIKTWSTGFNVWLEDDTSYIDWVVNSASGKFLEPYKVDLTAHPSFMEISSAKKQGDDFFVHETEGETLEELYRLLSQMAKTQLEDIVKAGFQLPEHQINHYVFGSKVSLMFITFDPCPEAHDIFKRFGKVFEQTYTRFLDLQKAEAQARESQIQLALERVRARTMAMQHSDELMETSELMFGQIKNLGIELWSCGFSLWYDDDSYFLGYNPGPHGKLGNPLKIPLTEDIFFTTIREAKRRGDEFLVFESEGESLVETYRYMDGLPVVGETMRGFVEAGFPLPTFQVTHCGFFSNGHLMFITQEPNPEASDIFRRFTKVFNQTYTRFLDLQKAEEQVREAQIEAALERVRSRSLAMHKTAELQSVIHTVHQELLNLNISISGGSFIVINSEIDNEIQCWGSGGTADTSDKVRIPRFEKPFYTHLLNGIKSGPGFFTEEYTREEKIEFFTFLFQHEPWSKLGEKEKKETLSTPGGYTRSCAVSRHTSIFIINHFGEKFPESENAILKRFGKVFEQAYTRFLDLQKAEAQAREAQIEAALERVRSRTMAMQSSSELGNVAAELFAQMNQLVTNLWTCGFVLCEKDRDEDEWWLSMDGDFTRGFFLPNVGDYAHATLYEGWLKGEALRAVQLDGETLQQHYDWLMEIPVSRAIFEEMDAAGLARPDWQKLHAAYFSKGYLVLITREPCGEEEIFKRFAQVFDQTYTRFLDLQKAEAQAREAQVNLAVERVRARALAMFKSEEILQVVHKLKDEIMGLDIPNVAAATIHLKEPDGMCRVWDLTSLEIEDDGLHLPLDIRFRLKDTHPGFFMRRVWENEADYFVVIQEKADFKHTVQWLRDNGLHEQANEAEAFFKSTQLPKVYHPTVPLNNGRMCIDLLDSPTPEVASILTKMAGAFDLAYKRFEDLQKAETQAKEAEIQLALERVRARSLAMHRSEELADLSMELVKQVQTLGMESWFCAFNIYDDDPRGSVEWGSNGQGTFPQYRTPREGVFLRYFEAGQRGETLLVNEIGEDECPAHYEYLCSLPGVGEQLLQMKAAGIPFPTSQIDHVAFFKYGYVLFITYEPAQESHDIFIRFAKVFEQSYTRFLDLQKAEAQAREAQIEAALEKVRSRSMGMQNSEELAEVIAQINAEITNLGIRSDNTTLITDIKLNEKSGSYCTWFSIPGKTYSNKFHIPRMQHRLFEKMEEAYRKKIEFFTISITKEEKDRYLNFAFAESDLKSLPEARKEFLLNAPGWTQSVVLHKNSGLVLNRFSNEAFSEEENAVAIRFGQVFEQTYTRFLDLQKAEAQTREAKIEAALEKVRSRTMGMQSSNELPEVANLLFLEVQGLGIPAWSCGYCILLEDRKSSTCIMSSEGTLQKPFLLPHFGEVSFEEWNNFVQGDQTFFTQELGGNAIESHYNFMKSLPQLTPIFKDIQDAGLSLPTYQINHLCKFTQGFILFITYEKVPESHAVFKRFTNVFDQTYTRFLDLKKAEAQAREAQIENALEKVRSRSLAMQSPDELIEVAQLLREEMGVLGVEELETSSIYIHDDNNGSTQCWFTIKNSENPGKSVTDQMTIDLQDTWVGRKMDEFYKSKAKQTTILMQGEQRIEWIRYCEEKSDLFGTSNFYGETIPDRTYHLYKFSNGYIGAAAPGEISTESWELLKRATAVFSFAYTRFRDLQMAEASARAAVRQASLDRVRAEISSMRHVDDLDRITPLFFQELTTLGIPFIRCGVFIIQEKQEIVEAYLSSPDGNSLGILRLPFRASELTFQTVDAWRKGVVYRQHWNKEDFVQWINQLMEQDQIQDSSTYQGTAAPPESLDLHFVPFAQGMLYVGAEEPMDEKELELVQALAKAFSIAYARYEDFVKLEQAKVEIESAMIELKATQSQLVQQEKLASLGQLTAGIAHEIKNPLNFVNNFSEVSIELVDEAIEERS
ncbi:nuclear transport factor 2 family protein, partial [Algoriphagus persicinus]|uniref:nuclear transport factor 2 family protein n=1 Tax=Algoriphagus persicinus TaxID=3108754 RepID=UPI002B38807A